MTHAPTPTRKPRRGGPKGKRPAAKPQPQKKAVIEVKAPSRLIQPADSRPRPLSPEIKARHQKMFPKRKKGAGGNRRSLMEQLIAKGIPSQFWPPLNEHGEPRIQVRPAAKTRKVTA